MKQIEDFIKHAPHCLAGKYSTIGRCNCGAQAALEELAALREAAELQRAADLPDAQVACEHQRRSDWVDEVGFTCTKCFKFVPLSQSSGGG